MATPVSRELTPAELALSEKRRLKKLQAAAANEKGKLELKELTDPRGAILPREWVSVPTSVQAAQTTELRTVRVMTWNVR